MKSDDTLYSLDEMVKIAVASPQPISIQQKQCYTVGSHTIITSITVTTKKVNG